MKKNLLVRKENGVESVLAGLNLVFADGDISGLSLRTADYRHPSNIETKQAFRTSGCFSAENK